MTRRPLFAASSAALAVALTAAAGGCHRAGPPKADAGLLTVTAARPLVDTITLFTNLTGTVEARETVEVRPRVSGYILEVRFKEGDEVKAGVPLFRIDPVIYEAQVKQAKGQVGNYEAQVRKAEADLARAREGVEKGVIAKSELDQALAAKGVAEAQLFTAKANLEQAEQSLAWTTVAAPIGGRVDRAYQTPGNLVTGATATGGGTGTVLTTIVSVDPMYAYFDVDEQTVLYYRRMIREGRIKSVQQGAMVDAAIQLRGETGFPHKGSLDFVSNRLNPGTGSLTIRGTFPNPDRFLIPGLFCRAQIPATEPFEAILIPPASVVSDQGRRVVYVVGAENRIEAREVEIGPLHRGLQVIPEGTSMDASGRTRGITRADRVVTRGMQRVEAGLPVDPQDGAIAYPPEPPAAPAGPAPGNPLGPGPAGGGNGKAGVPNPAGGAGRNPGAGGPTGTAPTPGKK